MQNLIIIRGLPGSGKSTVARKLIIGCPTYMRGEADMFYELNGEYKFNPKFIKYAHDWCFNNVVRSLFLGVNVIVANTFTTNWEMERYINLRDLFPNLNIRIIEVKTQFESIHNVPEEVMQKMKNRWEDVDPKWNIVPEVVK